MFSLQVIVVKLESSFKLHIMDGMCKVVKLVNMEGSVINKATPSSSKKNLSGYKKKVNKIENLH